MFDYVLHPAASAMLILGYPLYVLVMATVLRICGVTRQEVAKWALKQADRHRIADLVRAARGAKESTQGDESPNSDVAITKADEVEDP
jgi:hypothetical protein